MSRFQIPGSCLRVALWVTLAVWPELVGLTVPHLAGQTPAGPTPAGQAPAGQTPVAPLEGDKNILLVIQSSLTEAIGRAEMSLVAIAKVRANERLEGRADEPGPRIRFPQGLFGREPEPTDPGYVPQEFGTGVVIETQPRIMILTAYHVLGNIKQADYYVWIGKRPFQAKVIAADPWLDLAVLETVGDPKDLATGSPPSDGRTVRGGPKAGGAAADAVERTNPWVKPIEWGDAKGIKKGQFVIALGNPYAIARDGSPSASWGIVSNLNRVPSRPTDSTGPDRKETFHHFGTLIQTDAKLNFGTSGGALIDLQGRMIGLTTALTALTGMETAAGFAFPVDDDFKRAVDQLKQGKVPAYGFLGIAPAALSLEDRRGGRGGVIVSEVFAATPAAAAGLRHRDVITHVDGQPVYDPESLIRNVGGKQVGRHVVLTVERPGFLGKAAAPPKPIQLEVGLVKKYIATSRPPFASVSEPSWRGATIDFATAVPQFAQINALIAGQPCVAVAAVETDSPAWRAGLRAGDFITHVGKRRVAAPDQFHEAVQQATTKPGADVTVRLISDESAPVIRTIGL